jgi:indoleamine 2,3-dioxygenase
VLKELPVIDVSDVEDSQLLSALFRDYSFVASSYLLEPCDINFRKNGSYGLGRASLPKSVAVPFTQIAKKMNAKPFMEYALSYALYNYQRKDLSKGLVFDNLKLIRAFEGGESEFGFIAVHVTMVSNTGRLVSSVYDVLKAAESKNTKSFNDSLISLRDVMQSINTEMETMWGRSKSYDYNSFRTFIMGIKNQPIFPNGVIYEGVSDQPQQYRGESGANDSIVPTCDNLLQLTSQMPTNELTDILKDFRTYRPSNHSQWLSYVAQQADKLNIRDFAISNAASAVLYQACLDQVRDFRHRHWNFTKEYIIKNTEHPVGTGGSPIVTWLPNQLAVVMEAMVSVQSKVNSKELTPELKQMHDMLNERAHTQIRILKKEVEELRKKYPGQDRGQYFN